MDALDEDSMDDPQVSTCRPHPARTHSTHTHTHTHREREREREREEIPYRSLSGTLVIQVVVYTFGPSERSKMQEKVAQGFNMQFVTKSKILTLRDGPCVGGTYI